MPLSRGAGRLSRTYQSDYHYGGVGSGGGDEGDGVDGGGDGGDGGGGGLVVVVMMLGIIMYLFSHHFLMLSIAS